MILRSLIVGCFAAPTITSSGHVALIVPAYLAIFELLSGSMDASNAPPFTSMFVSVAMTSGIAYLVGWFLRSFRKV